MSVETEERTACEYVLRLFVAGDGALSHRAISQVKEVWEALPAGRCELEVVDVLREPQKARDAQILAVPTLIGIHPASSVRLVGDFVERRAVVLALGLEGGDGEHHASGPRAER